MPVTVSWFLQDRIILYRLSGIVTVEEISRAWKQAYDYRELVTTEIVHALYDCGEIGEVTLQLSAIANGAISLASHPRQGWIVIHNANDRLILIIGRVVAHSKGFSLHIAENEVEALDFLNRMDATLPPLRPLLAQADDQLPVAD